MWPFILSDRLLIVALVGLYPHQLANQTQAHLQAEAFSEASFSKCLMRYSYIHSVLAPLSKCCPHLEGRLLTRYSPVRHLVFTEINTPFDLHVLSTPPAFNLSQNQTLQFKSVAKISVGTEIRISKFFPTRSSLVNEPCALSFGARSVSTLPFAACQLLFFRFFENFFSASLEAFRRRETPL